MIRVYHDGPAPLIHRQCRAVGLTKTINEMFHRDPSRCRPSPGSRIEAIIINALTNRAPYRLERFFKGMDVERLFGPGIQTSDLNDDAVGHQRSRRAEQAQGRRHHRISSYNDSIDGV